MNLSPKAFVDQAIANVNVKWKECKYRWKSQHNRSGPYASQIIKKRNNIQFESKFLIKIRGIHSNQIEIDNRNRSYRNIVTFIFWFGTKSLHLYESDNNKINFVISYISNFYNSPYYQCCKIQKLLPKYLDGIETQ